MDAFYQLLFVANQAKRDIQTVISFLTMRVQEPGEDNGESSEGIQEPEWDRAFETNS